MQVGVIVLLMVSVQWRSVGSHSRGLEFLLTMVRYTGVSNF
jgi:hypothetical protein